MTRIATLNYSTATLDEGPAARKSRLVRRDVAPIDRYSGPTSGKIGARNRLIGVADLNRRAANRDNCAETLNFRADSINEEASSLNEEASSLNSNAASLNSRAASRLD